MAEAKNQSTGKRKGANQKTIRKGAKALTFTQALSSVFTLANQEIADRARVTYMTVATWRNRFENGKLSSDLANKILLNFYNLKSESLWEQK